jgi:hypothetical protein
MSGVLSAVQQLELLGPGSGSLDDFRSWWVEPILENFSLELSCSSSIAATRLERGLIEASHAYCDFPEMIAEYINFANSCVLNGPNPGDFAKPLWLDWIEKTAEAIREWRNHFAAMTTLELKLEFKSMAWPSGLAQINAGRPRVALRMWRHSSEQLIIREAEKQSILRVLRGDFDCASALAEILNVIAPERPGELASSEEWQSVLNRWWKDVADLALAKQFWGVHQSFLNREKEQSLRQLTSQDKKTLQMLIEAATKGRCPKFKELLKLTMFHTRSMDEFREGYAKHR